MRSGKASQTAVMTCMGRALAHGARDMASFADATALALLPEDAKVVVERLRAGIAPQGVHARLRASYLRMMARIMAVRTLAIDRAIQSAAAPQLVILGAGLDGRAWRLDGLDGVTVYEVDHPDSQRDKRARVGRLTQRAREVRFVPVDFSADDLAAALATAGHDPTRPTTWVWEGVAMYLTEAEIAAALAAIAGRSPAGSRLIVLYHSPALILKLLGRIVTGRVGEPLRSAFTPAAMRALLGRHGFGVVADADIATIGAALSPQLGHAIRSVRHLRLATAEAPGDRV